MEPADQALLDSWALSLHAKRPQTVELYLREVARFADWLAPTPLADVTKADVLRWIGDMQQRNLKTNTVRSRFYCARAFYQWLHAEQEIDHNPTVGVSIPRPHPPAPDPLTDDELARLFKACEGTGFLERRDLAMLRLFVATGLRAGEMVALELADLDLPNRLAVVRDGKGGRARVTRFDPATAAALDRYKRVRARHRFAGNPRLWIGRRGPATTAQPSSICDTRGAAAGIVGLHPHRLRHTFADRFLTHGGTEGDLQKLGGWENSVVMRRYGEARAVDRALNAYDHVDPMRGL